MQLPESKVWSFLLLSHFRCQFLIYQYFLTNFDSKWSYLLSLFIQNQKILQNSSSLCQCCLRYVIACAQEAILQTEQIFRWSFFYKQQPGGKTESLDEHDSASAIPQGFDAKTSGCSRDVSMSRMSASCCCRPANRSVSVLYA